MASVALAFKGLSHHLCHLSAHSLRGPHLQLRVNGSPWFSFPLLCKLSRALPSFSYHISVYFWLHISALNWRYKFPVLAVSQKPLCPLSSKALLQMVLGLQTRREQPCQGASRLKEVYQVPFSGTWPQFLPPRLSHLVLSELSSLSLKERV